jgi:hypothetical protein
LTIVKVNVYNAVKSGKWDEYAVLILFRVEGKVSPVLN